MAERTLVRSHAFARDDMSHYKAFQKNQRRFCRVRIVIPPIEFLSLVHFRETGYPYVMRLRNVTTSVCLSALLISASAFAQKAAIEGNAVDTNHKPLKNAEVRIQNEKTRSSPVMAKADAKGHFVASDLPAGDYTVTVFLSGTIKWSAEHVKAINGKIVHLNLSEHPAVAVASAAAQPKKRARWVPDRTGSRLGGHWEDEPARGPGGENVDQASNHQLEEMQRRQQTPTGN
jgi:hypothetical protein